MLRGRYAHFRRSCISVQPASHSSPHQRQRRRCHRSRAALGSGARFVPAAHLPHRPVRAPRRQLEPRAGLRVPFGLHGPAALSARASAQQPLRRRGRAGAGRVRGGPVGRAERPGGPVGRHRTSALRPLPARAAASVRWPHPGSTPRPTEACAQNQAPRTPNQVHRGHRRAPCHGHPHGSNSVRGCRSTRTRTCSCSWIIACTSIRHQVRSWICIKICFRIWIRIWIRVCFRVEPSRFLFLGHQPRSGCGDAGCGCGSGCLQDLDGAVDGLHGLHGLLRVQRPGQRRRQRPSGLPGHGHVLAAPRR